MAKHIVGRATGAALSSNSTTAKTPVGTRQFDQNGAEYVYVGASGVAVGAPVKVATTLSLCVVGTAGPHVIGVATVAFPSTGFTYGWVGTRGIHPTLVPSGVAAGSMVQNGNGTTAAATAPSGQSAAAASVHKQGVTLETAANAGTVINVYWF